MAKKKIEAPGAVEDTQASDEAAQHVEALSQYAEQINASDDENAKQKVAEMLALAEKSLSAIREQEQLRAAQPKRKADMSNITVNKTTVNAISGKGIRLTEKGYLVG